MYADRAKQLKLLRISYSRLIVAIALLAFAALAATASPAQSIVHADREPLTTLVKFDDRAYDVRHADWVSMTPLSSSTVKKISFGRQAVVQVNTTSSGTYSSDSLASPYVRYPGISAVRPVPPEGAVEVDVADLSRSSNGMSVYLLDRDRSGVHSLMLLFDDGVRSCRAEGSFVSCYRTR